MERYHSWEHAVAVRAALSALPAPIRMLVETVHVLSDTDPASVGLHYWRDATYGRSYGDTSHCVLPEHQRHLPRDRREITVVLYGPDATDPDIILHEFGHALMARLDPAQTPLALHALNAYAATNYSEAFAVAFRAWCNDSRNTDGWFHQNREELRSADPAAAAFFAALAVHGASALLRR